jgi:hypothetical protein
MDWLQDIVWLGLQVASPYDCSGAFGAGIVPTPPPVPVTCTGCTAGSAFTPIAAAFSTLGYYAQSGWLEQISDFGLGKIAIAVYLFAALGAILSFAMGGQAKQLAWFFIGPPLFWYFIDSRTPVEGVKWAVGDEPRDMREVWRMTELGLAHDDYVLRHGIETSASNGPVGGTAPTDHPHCVGGGACVSEPFAFFDGIISDTVQQLVGFLGVNRVVSTNTDPKDTNIIKGFDATPTPMAWDLAAQHRWTFFTGISQARIRNANIRRTFATFMGSACGKGFIDGIDKARLAAAGNRQDELVCQPVIKMGSSGKTSYCNDSQDYIPDGNWSDYPFLMVDNLTADVATPQWLTALFSTAGGAQAALAENRAGIESNIAYLAEEINDFRFNGVPAGSAVALEVPTAEEALHCQDLFMMLMQGFRWEAAHAAYQLAVSGPKSLEPRDFVAIMFNGWDIKKPNFVSGASSTGQINKDESLLFLEAFVLANMFRNEIELSPRQFAERQFKTVSQDTINDVSAYQRVNNQRAKFGELYTWAQMVPYFQGKLLYFLAIAYPFAAIFLVAPGMGRIFLQWWQFWLWVKLWDIGFAMVAVFERSVWAITSATGNTTDMNKVIVQVAVANNMPNIGVTHYCSGSLPPTHTVAIPEVAIPLWADMSNTERNFGYLQFLVDRLLAYSSNTDFDLANSYYMYIMSALYFAVPTVTGALVLGAKSGMASMVSQAMSGIASPAGGAAGNSAAGMLAGRQATYQAVASQQAFLDGAKRNGFAMGAIEGQNKQLSEGLDASMHGAVGQFKQAQGSALGGGMTSAYQAYSAAAAVHGAAQRALDARAGNQQLREENEAADAQLRMSDAERQSQMDGQGGLGAGLGGGAGARGGSPGAPGTAPIPRSLPGSNMTRMGNGYYQNITSTAGSLALNDKVQALARQSAGLGSEGYEASRLGTVAQMQGQMAGARAGRYEGASSYAGEKDSWMMRDDFNSGMAGTMAAITGSTGATNPGSLPTNIMGAAMAGDLGRDAKQSAMDIFAGGRTAGALDSHISNINSSGMSAGTVLSAYRPTSVAEAVYDSAGGAAMFGFFNGDHALLQTPSARVPEIVPHATLEKSGVATSAAGSPLEISAAAAMTGGALFASGAAANLLNPLRPSATVNTSPPPGTRGRQADLTPPED